MHILGLLFVLLILLAELNATRQHSGFSDYTYRDLLAGISRDCPLKCRCMALGHIGLQILGQNWQSDESWKAVCPRGLIDSDHQGKDMMCTGRGTIPWPMPDGRLNYRFSKEEYKTSTNLE